MKYIILSTSKNEIDIWKRYYDKIKNKNIYNDPDYIKYLEKYFYKKHTAELFICEFDDFFIYYPYFKRNLKELNYQTNQLKLDDYYDINTSWYYGGPILSDMDYVDKHKDDFILKYIENFKKNCDEQNIISEFIRFDPLIKNSLLFQNHFPVVYYTDTVYVDLTKNDDEIWNDFEGRNRTCIRKAIKNDIKIIKNEDDDSIKKFVEIYQSEMKRKEAGQHYWFTEDDIIKMREELGERFNLFLINYNNTIIGGGICLRENKIAFDYLAASLPDYWKYQPNNLLLYEEINWCKANGDAIYDLQGGRAGVFNFKAGFSKTLRGQFYTASIIHNESIYNELVQVAEIERGTIDNYYFPLYENI